MLLFLGFSCFAHSFLNKYAPNGVEVSLAPQIAPGDVALELDQFLAQHPQHAHHRQDKEQRRQNFTNSASLYHNFIFQ